MTKETLEKVIQAVIYAFIMDDTYETRIAEYWVDRLQFDVTEKYNTFEVEFYINKLVPAFDDDPRYSKAEKGVFLTKTFGRDAGLKEIVKELDDVTSYYSENY